jgi:predicted nucleic acid-binding protein
VRLSLDTSILGALTDLGDERRLALTRGLLQRLSEGRYVGVISNVVQEELERAPANLRQSILEGIRGLELELFVEDLESRRLFAVYEQARVVPARYRNDLRHVAVATVARADALVSWNFKHLVNLKTRRMVHATNLRLGYPLIDIVSPEEV